MKILLICNHATGLFRFRGKLIEAMIRRGYQVSAVIPSTKEADELESEEKLEKLSCKLIRADMDRRGMNPVRDMKLMLRYCSIIKQEQPDMVITYTIKPNTYGGMVCRWLKVPYAANITGLGTAFQKEGMLKKFVTILYKVALKRAKTVFFENAENRQIFLDAGIVKPEQTVLLNGAGVDLAEFPLQDYPATCDQTRFIFIGRVMQEKGIDELCQAIKQLNAEGIACSVDILGGFEENYADVLSSGEQEGWLRYHGFCRDTKPYVANSHCLVLPSWHEGMANVNLECAASGRPVITSNIHGCKEAVIPHQSGYLCEVGNVESLCSAMRTFCLLSMEQKRQMGICGRQHMEATFDKNEVVKATLGGLGL